MARRKQQSETLPLAGFEEAIARAEQARLEKVKGVEKPAGAKSSGAKKKKPAVKITKIANAEQKSAETELAEQKSANFAKKSVETELANFKKESAELEIKRRSGIELLEMGEEIPEEGLSVKAQTEEKLAKSYLRFQKAIAQATRSFEINTQHIAGRKRTPEEEKTYQRELIRHVKMIAKDIESRNSLHLVVFRSAGDGSWWKMGGNSVRIYQLMIEPCLPRQANVNMDRDNFSQFPNGVISIKGIEGLERDIEITGSRLVRDEKIDFGIFAEVIRAYRLPTPLSAAALKWVKDSDTNFLKSIYKNAYIGTPEIDIQNALRKATQSCFQVEKLKDSNVRLITQGRLFYQLCDVYTAYHRLANTRKEMPERLIYMRELYEGIRATMTTLVLYADLHIANRNNILDASHDLAKLNDVVRGKLNKMEGKNELEEKIREEEAENSRAAGADAEKIRQNV